MAHCISHYLNHHSWDFTSFVLHVPFHNDRTQVYRIPTAYIVQKLDFSSPEVCTFNPRGSSTLPSPWGPECSPNRDIRSTCPGYQHQRPSTGAPWSKVLELCKKFKAGNKNLSRTWKLCTTAEQPPAFRATHSNIQTNTGALNSGLSSSPAFRTKQSTIITQPHRYPSLMSQPPTLLWLPCTICPNSWLYQRPKRPQTHTGVEE